MPVPRRGRGDALLTAPGAAQVATADDEKVDYDAIYKIKDEGFQRSQVMDTASWLTDVYGPRLTGSPSFKAAATGPSSG